jgi:glycosyltransferase involved in cell wall biosynthesis
VRVLYFGTYERDYPRNAQVISCLRAGGVDVAESHVPIWDSKRHKHSLGPRDLGRMARAQLRLARRSAEASDVVVVGYPGHLDMSAARRVAGERPVVFNPLVSLEDTLVADRGLVPESSLRARVLRSIDRRAFRGADLVVADTEAHAAYFLTRFDLAEERLAVCLVGAEDAVFEPGQRTGTAFSVLFVGKLIPLHGVDTILAAAALCPDIEFRIVGRGQVEPLLSRATPNVRRDPWVEYDRLPDLYRSAGCALGIFGLSDKAARVIPNKAFQALATGTALVTADTPGARELLVDGRDALLVPAGDPGALAGAIRRLASDPVLRHEIADRGRATYVEHASEPVLGARWRSLLERLLARKSQRSGDRPSAR